VKQIDDLLAGFARFRANYFEKNPSLFEGLKRGQDPRFLVIACSDSRTDPAILFDAAPGDLFVVRNVANLVPPYVPDGGLHGVSSALEFGVRVLKVRHIIVLGHARCAGIRALVTDASGEFVPQWMKIAEPARQRTLAAVGSPDPDRLAHACEKEAIKVSLDNLKTFPWIATQVGTNDLFLHGWFFDLEQGLLSAYDRTADSFIPHPAR
jgi:carbonic anhydrase